MTVSKPPILTGGAFALTEPSEEYQAQFYRQTLAMAERVPTLRGMSPWILKNFRSPQRQNPDSDRMELQGADFRNRSAQARLLSARGLLSGQE